ncbi:MAG TPA: 4-oxalocrotonate tautomerase family protein [Mycobacterium sp.]|nr:4-oxalocrotonate tautomerase family protein [Mycobacterium sp.]
MLALAEAELKGREEKAEQLAAEVQQSEERSQIRSPQMPFINVKVLEGVFDADQKREIVERLTETMVGIEGENMRGVTWVVLEEVKSGDWAIGGKALSTDDVKALAAGTAS